MTWLLVVGLALTIVAVAVSAFTTGQQWEAHSNERDSRKEDAIRLLHQTAGEVWEMAEEKDATKNDLAWAAYEVAGIADSLKPGRRAGQGKPTRGET